MIKSNIQAGFRATGLVPYDPNYVILQLDVKFHTPTPLGSSAELPPAWVLKTPNNPIEAELQTEYIKNRIIQHQNSSPLSIIKSLRQLNKGITMMVYEQILMRYDLAEL
jgi:hypothetical protein